MQTFLIVLATTQNDGVRSCIDSLEKLFAIVLALALGEAFKQFVADRQKDHGNGEGKAPEPAHVVWDRLPGLLAFIFLIVPFSHGMGRYFFETYRRNLCALPYQTPLIVDSLVFLLEAAIFFVLSRRLNPSDWKGFYGAAISLLTIDLLWGFTATRWHSPALIGWVMVNLIALSVVLPAFLFAIRPRNASWCNAHPKTVAWIGCGAMFVRTLFDYYSSMSFYFPAP